MLLLSFCRDVHSFLFFFPSPGLSWKSCRLAVVGLLLSATDVFVDILLKSSCAGGGVAPGTNTHLKV